MRPQDLEDRFIVAPSDNQGDIFQANGNITDQEALDCAIQDSMSLAKQLDDAYQMSIRASRHALRHTKTSAPIALIDVDAGIEETMYISPSPTTKRKRQKHGANWRKLTDPKPETLVQVSVILEDCAQQGRPDPTSPEVYTLYAGQEEALERLTKDTTEKKGN